MTIRSLLLHSGLVAALASLASVALPAAADEVRAVTAAETHVAAHEEAIVGELRELLALPNIATSESDIRRNAGLLVEMLEKRGVDARILETPGAPVAVYGELGIPERAADTPFLCALRRPADRARDGVEDAALRAGPARRKNGRRRGDGRMDRSEIPARRRGAHLRALLQRRQGTDRRDAGCDRCPHCGEDSPLRQPEVLSRGRRRSRLAESREARLPRIATCSARISGSSAMARSIRAACRGLRSVPAA